MHMRAWEVETDPDIWTGLHANGMRFSAPTGIGAATGLAKGRAQQMFGVPLALGWGSPDCKTTIVVLFISNHHMYMLSHSSDSTSFKNVLGQSKLWWIFEFQSACHYNMLSTMIKMLCRILHVWNFTTFQCLTWWGWWMLTAILATCSHSLDCSDSHEGYKIPCSDLSTASAILSKLPSLHHSLLSCGPDAALSDSAALSQSCLPVSTY